MMMLLEEIFRVILLPLAGILVAYTISFLKKSKETVDLRVENEIYAKYMKRLIDTVTICVEATNQTYVDALKEKDVFTKEAQKEAFNKTYNAILEILGDETKNYFQEIIKDFDVFLKNNIESIVKKQKEE